MNSRESYRHLKEFIDAMNLNEGDHHVKFLYSKEGRAWIINQLATPQDLVIMLIQIKNLDHREKLFYALAEDRPNKAKMLAILQALTPQDFNKMNCMPITEYVCRKIPTVSTAIASRPGVMMSALNNIIHFLQGSDIENKLQAVAELLIYQKISENYKTHPQFITIANGLKMPGLNSNIALNIFRICAEYNQNLLNEDFSISFSLPQQLAWFHLNGNQREVSLNISHESIEVLSQYLKINQTIFSLSLANNDLYDAQIKTLIPGLRLNASIRILHLDENAISDEGVKYLADYLQNNATLQQLNLSCNEVADDGVEALAKALKRNQTLLSLNLDENMISDIGANALADVLKNNSTLTSLFLSHTDITQEGVLALLDSLKNNPESKLSDLGLASCGATDVCAERLAEWLKTDKNLKKLYLAHNQMTANGCLALAESLTSNNIVSHLKLDHNKIADLGAAALGEMLKANHSIEILCLQNIDMTTTGLEQLTLGLAKNQSLKTIDLANNRIGDGGVKFLSKVLATNQTLENLMLFNNGFTCSAVRDLIMALKQPSSLENLDLSCNHLSDEGLIMLMQSLKNNNTLCYLNISNTGMTDESAKAIGELLNLNQSLKVINMSANNITDQTAKILATCLETNTTIYTLMLPEELIPGDLNKTESLFKIDLLIERNILIAEYPHFADYIIAEVNKTLLGISSVNQSSVFRPQFFNPPSLVKLSGAAVIHGLSHRLIRQDAAKQLPEELVIFVNKLVTLRRELAHLDKNAKNDSANLKLK